MKVLCIGNEEAYKLYMQGIYPSHHLYGAVEIRKAGYDVVIKQPKKSGLKQVLENAGFVFKEKPDILFLPFINIHSYFLIFLLKRLFIFNFPVIGFMHRTPNFSGKLNYIITRFLLRSVDMPLFLSPLNQKECVNAGIVDLKKNRVLDWGGDLSFYDKFRTENQYDGKVFISTGKENRDFKTLISGFSQTSSSLRIFANYFHASRTYNYLDSFTGKYPNVEIKMIENDSESFSKLLNELKKAYCVVVPLMKENLNYCVGLSSIADALCFGKPIIVSDNPYFPIDVEKEKVGIKVKTDDPQSWAAAVDYLEKNPEVAKAMGQNARILAEKKYNMEKCGNALVDCIRELGKKN